MKEKVVVVIVTYGSRWHLLREVLRAVLSDSNASGCVIVDNGSTYSVRAELEKADWIADVSLLEQGENKGSAVGYSAGIRYAVNSMGADYIFMLDDDNRPEQDALAKLLTIALADSGNKTCPLALRNDRPEQLKALDRGFPLIHQFDSFSGFHVGVSLKKIISALLKPPVKDSPARGQVEVEFAPYGGLLIPRAAVEIVGYPYSDYFVYADDHEFTTRISWNGYRIILVADARVEDLETSWHLKKNGAVSLFSTSVPLMRLAYSVRNRVDFERRYLVKNRVVYIANAAVYLGVRFVRSVFSERRFGPVLGRFFKYAKYAIDGWNGRLGKIKEL